MSGTEDEGVELDAMKMEEKARAALASLKQERRMQEARELRRYGRCGWLWEWCPVRWDVWQGLARRNVVLCVVRYDCARLSVLARRSLRERQQFGLSAPIKLVSTVHFVEPELGREGVAWGRSLLASKHAAKHSCGEDRSRQQICVNCLCPFGAEADERDQCSKAAK